MASEMVGIGICTYNRPDYFKQCIEHVLKNVSSVDIVITYNDGSSVSYDDVYASIKDQRVSHIRPKQNLGVAHAKNTLLKELLAAGCDDLFLLEDDILILDDRAVTEYIRIGKMYGFEHFMFAHHGDANSGGPAYGDDFVEYFPACVGAWCYYTKNCIRVLEEKERELGIVYPGFFDENFKNAWEHVEHSKRIGDVGLSSWWGLFPDIKHSKEYITEIPGSIDNSSIRPNKKWRENQVNGLKYWEEKWGVKPDINLPDEEGDANENSNSNANA